jgi:sulfatase maturation enzyme AslB (radical SAM superfamily)
LNFILYRFNKQHKEIILILYVGNKNDIKEIIGELTQSDHTKIKKIKRKFRKYLQVYSAGVDGTRKYHEFIRIRMRSRNSFKKIIVNIENIKENIRSNQNQKRFFGPDTVMLEQMI